MRNGKTCGAFTGAFMILGLKFGTQNCENADSRKNVYDAVVGFTKSFEQLHNSTNCEELLGCNVATADGMHRAKEENLFYTICPKYIKSSAEILEAMLDKKNNIDLGNICDRRVWAGKVEFSCAKTTLRW